MTSLICPNVFYNGMERLDWGFGSFYFEPRRDCRRTWNIGESEPSTRGRPGSNLSTAGLAETQDRSRREFAPRPRETIFFNPSENAEERTAGVDSY